MPKEFDVVILGASGFAGQMVVEEMAKKASASNIKWAVAGRDLMKVQNTLAGVSKRIRGDLTKTKIFVTDVTDSTSLETMCKDVKLVINCVGPYEKLGEPVVAACVKHKTHIVDMTAELMFINRIILNHFHEAEAKGVYIISACGNLYLFYEMVVPVLEEAFDGGVDSIEVHIKPITQSRSIHNTTWESMINMSTGLNPILSSRQKIYSQIMKVERSKWSILAPSWPMKRNREVRNLSFKLPAIIHTADLGLDMRESLLKEKSMKLDYYCVMDSIPKMIRYSFLLFKLAALLPFSSGRRMLTKYPETFSSGMVTKSALSDEESDIASGNFIAVAKGWGKKRNEADHNVKPNKTVVLHGTGPPAYRNSAICMVQAAITVLQETESLPNRGGIYTPLAAFSKTSLPSRLQNHGITYKIE